MGLSSPKPKLLMVTTDFPPGGGSGLLRMLGFARGLEGLGWAVVVLTVRQPGDRGELTEWVPESVSVRRIPMVSARSTAGWLGRAGSFFKRGGSAKRNTIRVGDSRSTGSLSGLMWNKLRDRLKKLDWFIAPASGDMGWSLGAIPAGLRAASQADIILSSFGPDAAHMVGMCLHRLTGTPWVADFRDPYVDNQVLIGLCSTFLHRRFMEKAEKSFVRNANHIVTTTHTLAEVLAERYGRSLDGDFTVIHNGYDAGVFGPIQPRQELREKPFELAYFGSAYDAESFVPFLKAVRAFISSISVDSRDWRVVFVGSAANVLKNICEELKLGSHVVLRGSVGHREAVEMMRASTALFVVREPMFQRLCIPAKIYQYMLSNRPILCIAGQGPLRQLCENHTLGPCVDVEDVEGIGQAIRELFELHQAGRLLESYTYRNVEQYSRRALTKKLDSVLKSVIRRHEAGK